MSPRPRKASDDEVFAATMRTMSRLAPRDLTLNDIAAEAGLTASALVQRFGSKRALLLTLAERFAHSAGPMFAELRAGDPSPLATIYAYGDCMAQMGQSPDVLAHHLSWLQQDLTDPDFRRFTLIHARASRRELQRLVEEAVREGALKQDVNPARLARAIEVTVGGSLMTWAMHQEGRATAWMRDDLDALLGPLVTRRDHTPRARKSTRKRSRGGDGPARQPRRRVR